MKQILSLCALACGLLTTSTFAVDASCDSQATEKKLAGAAKTSFLKKCEADAGTKPCDAQASEKKLAGAAKASFLKKCTADAKPAGKSAQETCDSQAADKKLAGAAKASFVKKCVSDAS